MNRKELLAELRRLFAEEQKVQWRIGDLLVREVGAPGSDHTNTGALDEIEEIANDLEVSLATLLKYRRLAATYPDDTRISSVSWSAHEAASMAADPVKVLAQAQQVAANEAQKQTEKTGKPQKAKVTVPLVREIAAKPQHQKPGARLSHPNELRSAPGGWGLQLISAMDGATSNLRRIVTMLQAVGSDEELPAKTERMLLSAMERCEGQITWIRAYLRGEDVANEAAEFLQEQA